MDKLCARYGTAPRAFLGVSDPWEGVLVDVLCFTAGAEERAEALKEAGRRKALVIPAILMESA